MEDFFLNNVMKCNTFLISDCILHERDHEKNAQSKGLWPKSFVRAKTFLCDILFKKVQNILNDFIWISKQKF